MKHLFYYIKEIACSITFVEWLYIALALILSATCIILHIKNETLEQQLQSIKTTTVIKTDTVKTVKTDTVFIKQPKIFTRDTLFYETIVYKADTIKLPRESVAYQEDSLYTAYVSGINPSLDSISVYPKKEYITITKTIDKTTVVEKQCRLGIGPYVGAGIDCNGRIAPTAGIAISYSIFKIK